MKKKVIMAIMIIVILLVLFVPMPMYLNDGGTVEYKALTYKISKYGYLLYNADRKVLG